MARVGRRAYLVDMLRILAFAGIGGCNPSEVVAPPGERIAQGTKTAPPPSMKPQENFDPRKRLREKGGSLPAPPN